MIDGVVDYLDHAVRHLVVENEILLENVTISNLSVMGTVIIFPGNCNEIFHPDENMIMMLLHTQLLLCICS